MIRLKDLVDMRIIEAAREKGYLTCQDIRPVFPDRIRSPREIGRIRSLLERSNIEVRSPDHGGSTKA